MATSTPKHGAHGAAKSVHKPAIKTPVHDGVPIPPGPDAILPVEGLNAFRAVALDKRYVPARLPTGKVLGVWGDAIIRTPDGDVRPLVPGDEVKKGDVILTAQNGIVQMEADGSRFARLPDGSELQGPVAQLNALDQFEAPSAGQGDLGSLYNSTLVDRISESVAGQQFSFDGASALGDGTAFDILGLGPNQGLSSAIELQNIAVPESGVVIAGGVQPAAVNGTPGFAVFTVNLETASVAPVTLKFNLTAGTSTLGSDFGTTTEPHHGMQISIDGGETWSTGTDETDVPLGVATVLVRVPLIDDTLDENDETFRLTATRTSPGEPTVILNATATILDNDPPPDLSSANAQVSEDGGTATFTLTLSAPSGKTITLDWSTADGTAKAGEDYVAAGGQITFAPGETSKTVTIDLLSDRLQEGDETFNLTLGNPVNVNLPTPTYLATLVDNDHAPVVPGVNGVGDEDTVQQGNVLTNASDADGDTITVVNFTVDPIGNFAGGTAPAGGSVVVPGIGTISIGSDGAYTFQPAPNYNGTFPTVHFVATDGANPVQSSLDLSVTAVNDAPDEPDTPTDPLDPTGAGRTTVFEAGLLLTQPSATEPTQKTGQLTLSDVDSPVSSLRVSIDSGVPDLLNAAPITANGIPVTWKLTSTADGQTLTGKADSTVVFTATLSNTGAYDVQLHAPVDKGAVDLIQIGLHVTDDLGASTAGSLDIAVRDDQPTISPQLPAQVTVERSDTNLLFVLDNSGSMATRDGIDGLSRLDSAIQSISKVLDQYSEQGAVAVRIVTFSSEASDVGGKWLTVAEAKTLLATIQAQEETNYRAGLTEAITAFDAAGRIASGKNVAYFFSDGLPSLSSGPANVDVNTETAWKNFLDQNLMRSVAIGLGTEPNTTELNPVAYDGSSHADTSATLVTDFKQLDAVLAGTVAPLSGFLAGASATDVGGADLGFISRVSIDGVDYGFGGGLPGASITASKTGSTFSYNADTHQLTVLTQAQGTLRVDMDDGQYSYTPPANASSVTRELVSFAVSDRDGDSAGASFTIVANPVTATVAAPATATAHILAATDSSTTGSATGSEQLTATPLADVFHWTLADAGTAGHPTTTHIGGFSTATTGGDQLDLRDLLQGELGGAGGTMGNLGHYLDFSVAGSGAQATTTLQVSAHGGFDPTAPSASQADKLIVLDGVDLRSSLGLDAQAANQQIIESLLQHGKLLVDSSNNG
jgi:Mg-chelatase subunit ChlD